MTTIEQYGYMQGYLSKQSAEAEMEGGTLIGGSKKLPRVVDRNPPALAGVGFSGDATSNGADIIDNMLSKDKHIGTAYAPAPGGKEQLRFNTAAKMYNKNWTDKSKKLPYLFNVRRPVPTEVDTPAEKVYRTWAYTGGRKDDWNGAFSGFERGLPLDQRKGTGANMALSSYPGDRVVTVAGHGGGGIGGYNISGESFDKIEPHIVEGVKASYAGKGSGEPVVQLQACNAEGGLCHEPAIRLEKYLRDKGTPARLAYTPPYTLGSLIYPPPVWSGTLPDTAEDYMKAGRMYYQQAPRHLKTINDRFEHVQKLLDAGDPLVNRNGADMQNWMTINSMTTPGRVGSPEELAKAVMRENDDLHGYKSKEEMIKAWADMAARHKNGRLSQAMLAGSMYDYSTGKKRIPERRELLGYMSNGQYGPNVTQTEANEIAMYDFYRKQGMPPEEALKKFKPAMQDKIKELIQNGMIYAQNPRSSMAKQAAAGSLAYHLQKQSAVTLDIEKGDTLLGGRYKNIPHEVKELGTDELGQPTINGMKLLAFRIAKKMPKKKD